MEIDSAVMSPGYQGGEHRDPNRKMAWACGALFKILALLGCRKLRI